MVGKNLSLMDDCSDYVTSTHHGRNVHHQQQHKLSSALSSNSLSSGGTRSRRSSYGHNHYQQPLVATPTINYHDDMSDVISPQGPIIPAPSRYTDIGYATIGNRILHSERYIMDDNMSQQCLQPPSPAPNNDHYVMGIPSPSHYQERRYQVQHRTLSPNTRYRTSLPDYHRDLSPKCERFIQTPTHFLASSTPLSSSDNYSYLTSNVHTPVKRYIPTPPPQENYQPPQMNMIPGPNSQQLQRSHMTNTLPYRFRVKSCPNEQSISQGYDQNDHYATPPRVRPTKVPSSLNSSSCGTPTSSSQTNTSSGRQSRQSSDYQMARTSSVEYLDQPSCRISTPISVMSEPAGNGSASCLHCNTLRRTTGVHQTTQTSGPISPQQSIVSPSTVTSNSNSDNAAIEDRQSPTSNNGQMSKPTLTPSSSQNKIIDVVKSTESREMMGTIPRNKPQNLMLQYQPLPSVPQPEPISIQPVQPIQPQPIPSPAPPQQQPQISNDYSPASTLQRNAQPIRLPNVLSRKQRIKDYIRHETAKFFGVDNLNEEYEKIKWEDRQKRMAIRRFGELKDEYDFAYRNNNAIHAVEDQPQGDRPDILPAQSQDERDTEQSRRQRANPQYSGDNSNDFQVKAARKPSVGTMMWDGVTFVIQAISRRRLPHHKQWSRSFAPAHVDLNSDDNDMCDGLTPIQDDETFFDTPAAPAPHNQAADNSRQIYMTENNGTAINGWRTKSSELQIQQPRNGNNQTAQRISTQILDGVLDNSVRPIRSKIKMLRPNLLDDRYDYRPFFTYWINTVQILVLVLSLICYGFAPVGIGMEHKSAQVLVTSLSLQQVQHQEPRNVWIGLRTVDLVHLGAKYGACMRRDGRISDVISKTKRMERETACCIRNDDSGCVQSSQAECSLRGLWPTKSISTWKKWSPGDSGPGGRISGSVCGLDPKYCDAPASMPPHEWPDDITKWPICRKNNQLSQRFRFKDHTAEHMVCEVIGHPCCTGIYGECRITTREYCDFINGYFHEEASLCSQISCLNDVCGMFPFMLTDIPDQFYRLFTSLILHAGIIHLVITVAFQHILLSDLERLIGPMRTAIIYIGSGIAGNMTSAIFVPYKAEVGPLPALAGVVSSLAIQLILCHWKSLKKPHLAMIKLLVIGCILFGLGTLPWQQNFTGLIAGLLFGIGLTLAFVPFVNVTKHSRKSKINLIWTCIILYFIIYAIMFIIFYIFPTLFSSLNFIDGNQVTEPYAGNGLHDHYNIYDNNIFNNKLGNGNGIGHNHHDYGGRDTGGGISMSGGINKINSKNSNLKIINLCEKGQCVQRQPRRAVNEFTNA